MILRTKPFTDSDQNLRHSTDAIGKNIRKRIGITQFVSTRDQRQKHETLEIIVRPRVLNKYYCHVFLWIFVFFLSFSFVLLYELEQNLKSDFFLIYRVLGKLFCA